MEEKRIKLLRENINTVVASEHYDTDKLLGISKKLDELILEAMKEMGTADKNKAR